MRICFFNRSYYPDVGATGQLLAELAEDLVRQYGCEVSVVAGPPVVKGNDVRPSGWGLVRIRTQSHNGVKIIRTGGTAFRPTRFAARAVNYMSYFLTACIAGFRVPQGDVVISLTDPPIIGLAALLTARRHGSKFVFLCQDVFPEVANLLEDFRSETLNRVLDRINRVLIRKADRVVALGETMRERLIVGKGCDSQKIAVIHNWADCSAIVPREKRSQFSLTHELAERFVVMYSGNVGLSQDLNTLVDAASRLRRCEDLIVAVVGDGAKREALEARAKSQRLANVRFLPYQPKERLVESFASADVFIVSLRRGLAGYIVPSKLYGVLAAGRPYVAAVDETCEVATITRKYDCGLVAEPGDPEDLAEKILALYRDRQLARRLGENARRAALEFDRPLQVRQYYDLFNELTRGQAPDLCRSLRKRLLDVLLSAFGLLLSAPLWVLIALAIKLEDGGPIFYGQERVGRGGKRFSSRKFRSMIANSDETFGPLQARQGDSRITRTGRVLRATAMDELPQLWSILKGDMSFVGPRALMPEEIEVNGDGELVPLERIPGYVARHQVTPGLTGIAQIYAPRDLPRRHKFKFDLLYIKKRSFGLDLRLIALSVWIALRGRWEHPGEKF